MKKRRVKRYETILIAIGPTGSSVLVIYNFATAPRLVPANIDLASSIRASASPEGLESGPEEESKSAVSEAASSAEAGSSTAPAASFQAKLVDINSADLAELKTIKGIGDVKAQAIIDYRSEHGPFNKPEDLIKVKGIGEKTLAKLLPYIKTE